MEFGHCITQIWIYWGLRLNQVIRSQRWSIAAFDAQVSPLQPPHPSTFLSKKLLLFQPFDPTILCLCPQSKVLSRRNLVDFRLKNDI